MFAYFDHGLLPEHCGINLGDFERLQEFQRQYPDYYQNAQKATGDESYMELMAIQIQRVQLGI